MNARPLTGNPYESKSPRPDSDEGHAAQDLDASAPVLRSAETRRLNRKALAFLAGILALLLLMTVWMVRSAASGNEQVARPREETVVIPALPQAPVRVSAVPATPPVDPIQVEPVHQLPPLPPAHAGRQPKTPASVDLVLAPSLMERRTSGDNTAANAGSPQADYLKAMLAAATGSQAKPEPVPKEASTSARFIHEPDALLVRGTYIRCVLETRIVTDIAGFTSCVVTEPVYSINGQRLLVPRGSKVSGRYGSGEPGGPRVSVLWDRITTPTGVDVTMASPGVDNLGGAGHPGDYDAHWPARISSALLISLIGDGFKIAAAEHGPPTTTIAQGVVVQEPYESATARTMERLANQALHKNMARPATVTIEPGEIVNIYVARDVDFSAVVSGG